MDQATHNKISSFIWGIADDVLRDLFRRGKYPDVILPMCVIRRMDAVLDPTKKQVLQTKQKKAAIKIALADEDAEIAPVPTDARGHKPEPEMDRLSNILKTFNEQFGTLFNDGDRVAQRIRDDSAPKVAADAAYQNAMENTPHTARMAHDQALAKVMQHLLKDDTQVYKQFVENEAFKRFVGDMVFAITNQ